MLLYSLAVVSPHNFDSCNKTDKISIYTKKNLVSFRLVGNLLKFYLKNAIEVLFFFKFIVFIGSFCGNKFRKCVQGLK